MVSHVRSYAAMLMVPSAFAVTFTFKPSFLAADRTFASGGATTRELSKRPPAGDDSKACGAIGSNILQHRLAYEDQAARRKDGPVDDRHHIVSHNLTGCA